MTLSITTFCYYAECRYAECRGEVVIKLIRDAQHNNAECRMISTFMLNAIFAECCYAECGGALTTS